MAEQYVQFIGGAYAGRDPAIDPQQLINYYIESDPASTGETGKRYAVPTPGLTVSYTFTGTTGTPRGLYYYGGKWLAVIGNALYSWDGTTQTTIGTLATSTGRCQFIDDGPNNGKQVLIVDSAGNGYVYNSGVPSFTQMTNGTNGWPTGGAGAITFQDGYALLNQANSPTLWWSNPYDFSTINGLNFATKEGHLDNISAPISDGTRVYLLGIQTSEVWYDQGLLNEAFARLPGAFYYKGCLSQYALSIIDSSVVWLGCDNTGYPQIYQARGTSAPVAISTPQIEYQLSKSTLSDAFAFTYMQQGHLFWVLTLPTTGVTWVWDATTTLWHQRASTGSTHGEWLPYYISADAGSENAPYCMDNLSANLYKIDPTNNTDDGTTINRTIVGPTMEQAHIRIFGNGVEVRCNAGVGSGPTSGTITLAWSKDNTTTYPGSITWTLTSSPTQRLYQKRLGFARQWTFKLTTSTNAIIYGLIANPMTTERLPAFPSVQT